MYRGFNLTLSKSEFSGFKDEGRLIKEKAKQEVEKSLDYFVDKDRSLLATKITDHWFPQVSADVFISHSHEDHELAINFAGWLKAKFGLEAFIDSCVWGYSNDLLRKIDNKYCLHEYSETYDYAKRNKTTSHVNMMLSTALAKMIDNCECIIFLNTPSSVSCEGYINDTATYSPWIYSEIVTTQIIKKIQRRRGVVNFSEESMAFDSVNGADSLSIKYDLDLGHLKEITKQYLDSWLTTNKVSGAASLDTLYSMR